MGLKHGRGFDIDPKGISPIDSFMRNRVEGMMVSDGTTDSTITATGTDLNLDISPGFIIIDGKVKAYSAGVTDYAVDASEIAGLITVGSAIVYTLVAFVGLDDVIDLRLFAGAEAVVADAVAVTDAVMAASFDDRVTAYALSWVRFHRSDTAVLTITIDDTVRPLLIPA